VRQYFTLLRMPGAANFVIAGFVARLPIAMRSIGCVLMVSLLTDSYALAGVVAGVLILAQAAAAPLAARLADRRRQSTVLMITLPVNALATVTLAVLCTSSAPRWAMFAAAAISGASALPVGSLVRARWTALASDGQLSGAFALEGVLDELIYITGPMLVTALAVSTHPAAGTLGALILYLSGGVALALQWRTEPPQLLRDEVREKSRLGSAGIYFLLVTYLFTGVFFGSYDVALIAFAGEHDAVGIAGLLLSLLAVSSLVSGLLYGTFNWRIAPERRLLLSTFALAVGTVPLAFSRSITLTALLTLSAGVAVSPILISAHSVLERLVPHTSLTEGFAWLSSAITLGMAVGSAAGGALADTGGSITTLMLSIGSAALAFAAAALGLRPMARQQRSPIPALEY
jgi:MFS family permease